MTALLKRSECLKQCNDIRAEISQLEKEIKEESAKPWDFGTDSVVGSSKCEPFQKHSITISGIYQSPEAVQHIKNRLERIKKFKSRLEKSRNDAEDYLETVPCSIDRVILRGYYIEGKEWQAVAADLTETSGKDYSEAAVKMRAKRFFEKN
jgi:hypothetical protein